MATRLKAARDVPDWQRRLAEAVAGEVAFDPFTLGRYATDASSYQIMPAAVVIARDAEDVHATLAVAREAGVSVTPRGAGTSQCGQTVNDGIIVDTTRHMNNIVSVDAEAERCVVEPGVVLDELNRALAPTGLWFPVDISTSSRATIGGMAGNNACGGRSLRYGTMRDNVEAIDAVLADGTALRFGEVEPGTLRDSGEGPVLARDLLAIGKREADEVAKRFPKVQRRVGGYNLDALAPAGSNNLAHLLVGSEGTLAFSTNIELRLATRIGPKVMGVCHFGSFHAAVDAARHLVGLGPIALELIDRTMIALGRDIPLYRDTINRIVRGDPAALLIAEFAEDEHENRRRLKALAERMDELGIAWDHSGDHWGGVVPLIEPETQAALTEVRKSGLNIMMSMKEQGKPVSFVEDCAVPLEHLAEYTERLTALFEKHGTTGTWYAHAAVGCLHVRPILNLKLEHDLKAVRAIAEEAFALVRDYKGSHSGEHGDGIVRSEFHEFMFGPRIVRAFEAVKDRVDPDGVLNPGKIVRAPRMDDRRLLRYGPHYRESDTKTVLDWSAWPGPDGGFQAAVEMCNNNGACRKFAGGVMCPSWRVTRDEKHLVRGRANTLRLALSGQLGPDAMASDAMADVMELCVSCKACRRECPTGVDMARMKIEVLAARSARRGLSLRDRIFGHFPRIAPLMARAPWLSRLPNRIPGLPRLIEAGLGLSSRRSLPEWSGRPFTEEKAAGPEGGPPVALFADTFNRWIEPDILRDAVRVLAAAGHRVVFPAPADKSGRALCCGRTYLSVGRVDLARLEMERTAAVFARLTDDGIPIVGLEPSCLLTFRDELAALLPGEISDEVAANTFLLEEFLVRRRADALPHLPLGAIAAQAHVHGHCHQKSFGVFGATTDVLAKIPGLEVTAVESGCCGMAGAFGYQAETYDVSMAMAEIALLPAIRTAPDGALIVAAGTSCRHQIRDGTGRTGRTGRTGLHPAQVLALSIDAAAAEAGETP